MAKDVLAMSNTQDGGPTCGAGPGEKCELSTGLPRTEPHRYRRLVAKD